MPNRIEIDPRAIREARCSFQWYKRRSPGAAARFEAEIERVIHSILADPLKGYAHPSGARVCLLKKFPFKIIYDVQPGLIQIIAIAHTSRIPGYWKRRIRSRP